MVTDATTAKIARQIVVVNQKTKSIRSRSFPAEVGSHGTNNATAAEAAPMTTPRTISWKSEPLRTDFETYSTRVSHAGATHVAASTSVAGAPGKPRRLVRLPSSWGEGYGRAAAVHRATDRLRPCAGNRFGCLRRRRADGTHLRGGAE